MQSKDKKEEIWPSPMTKAPTSKYQNMQYFRQWLS